MRAFGVTITELLSAFGLTGEIAAAVTAAELDPTSRNVNAVVEAYAKNGQVVPGQLYAHLLQINQERHPDDTVAGAAFPWLLAGAGLLYFFLRRKS